MDVEFISHLRALCTRWRTRRFDSGSSGYWPNSLLPTLPPPSNLLHLPLPGCSSSSSSCSLTAYLAFDVSSQAHQHRLPPYLLPAALLVLIGAFTLVFSPVRLLQSLCFRFDLRSKIEGRCSASTGSFGSQQLLFKARVTQQISIQKLRLARLVRYDKDQQPIAGQNVMVVLDRVRIASVD